MAGALIEFVLIVGKFAGKVDFSSSAWFPLGFFFMIGGLIAFSFGIVIDLLMKIHLNNSPYEKRYYVRDVLLR